MAQQGRRYIGEFLVEKKFITKEQLQAALTEQKATGELLGIVLIRMNAVSEETVSLAVIASQLDVDFIHLKDFKIDPAVLQHLPAKFASHYRVFPVSYVDGVLTVAMSNPLEIQTLDDLGMIVKARIRSVLALEKDILEAIKEHYGTGADTVERMMTGREPGLKADALQERQGVEMLDNVGSDASISLFLNQILSQAHREHATDVHIESFENEVRIRYRIDGVLYDTNAPDNLRFFRDTLISRIKIMASLNIAEKRLPQDGRFRVNSDGKDLDLRVSFLPTPLGESVVIRILNATRLHSFQELGFADAELAQVKILLEKPHGVVFVTGPTGSGKTTTLYTFLASVNKDDVKIITVEDPVEYEIKGITQVQVNTPIGLTFAATLRSMLRHDPDILMVGEVRDAETAAITIPAALTGHLVFSTLHTNDAAGGVTRLLDMGVEPYLIASAVECFIAQRLVRRLCLRCRIPGVMDEAMANAFGLQGADRAVTVYGPKGCPACRMTGFQGRHAILEFLMMNDEIRSLVTRRATASDIKIAAIRAGMKTIKQHGWEKVKAGLTSPSEVLHVTK